MEQDRVVVVTGSAKRLGRELAIFLATEGYRLVLHCNTSVREATCLQKELQALGHKSAVVQGDLTDLRSVESLFSRFVEPFGKVDDLVNSASVFSQASLQDTSVERWQLDMALHAGAPFFLSKALYLHLQNRGASGSVVNITDTQIEAPPPSRPSYYLSKASLAEETRILARTLAPTLRVNAVAPGLVLPNGEDAFFAKMERVLPLQRCGTPSDVCQAVSYLLSASFVTGVTLAVDGGHHLL
ncbi:SDR family oxidoreductase [Sphaerochaeta sp. PS]|uniref:SDR family oxidoreductase n=1 Tax=Sphaerochaeta sp. PS TaxID=3076336 RepID=UPI0028A2E8C4|nr:SDR family oxidoreductase [Sphaerochaeta sp. PS]MDT4761889.1 SDR family oxidoreductase [Sphaerochaeta sp. PS]